MKLERNLNSRLKDTKCFQHILFSLKQKEKLKDRLIQLSANVGSMENQMQEDRLTLMTLQNQALNESLQRCKDENQPHIQDAQIRSVQGQLQALKEQVRNPIVPSLISRRTQKRNSYFVQYFSVSSNYYQSWTDSTASVSYTGEKSRRLNVLTN